MLLKFFRRFRRPRDISEELEAHIALEAKMLAERGVPHDQALRQARVLFGNRTQFAEDARAAWIATWLDRLWGDCRFALRTAMKTPSFAVAAVLSIALGVGSATGIFTIADAVFLRPLPYPHPEELISVGIRFPAMPSDFLPSPDYVAWRRDNKTLTAFAATQMGGPQQALLNGPHAAEVQVARVSSNFLETFKVALRRGRQFAPADELPESPGTAILSHRFWTTHFGGASGAIGEVVSLSGRPYTVIGILPPSFSFPTDAPVDILTTLPVSPIASHHDRSMSTWAAFGRLKPGATIRDAQTDLNRLFVLSKADLPVMFQSDTTLLVEPLAVHRTRHARTLFFVLLATVSCLLLISCANVANLMLGRWAARQSELAIRVALGAGRARLTRQLFTEAAVMAAAGATLGAAVAYAAIQAFVYWAAAGVPRLSEITLDARVFLIGATVSLGTTLLFGLLPALVARRADLRQSLVHTPKSHGRAEFRLLRHVLVAGEVALSVVLLSAAALLLQSLWNLRNRQVGFEAQHALTITVPVKGTAVENRQPEFSGFLLDFLRSTPGTVAAAESECTPLSGGPMLVNFSRSDRPLPKPFERGNGIQVCSAGSYYEVASGQHIVRGRFFTPADASHPQTLCVLNETAARTFLPGEDPIGKRILGSPAWQWKTIVGVLSDSKNAGLNAPPSPQAILNEPSRNQQRPLFLLRTLADPHVLQSSITAKLKSFDPGLIAAYKTLDEDMYEKSAGPRFDALLISGFALAAFIMTVVGIYGVLSFTTAARTHELGIRLAIGAQPRRLFASVLFEGILLALVGAAIGIISALMLARYLRTLVYGVAATDVPTYLAVVIASLLVAAAASAIPARRASAVDPAIALRVP